jgi:hypothetical protein
MSGNPHHDHRRRGRRLAHELEQFIRREVPTREEAAEVLIGAYEYFAQQTRFARGEGWPPEAPDAETGLDPPSEN